MKPCRHLASLSMGKLTDRLTEGPAIFTSVCISESESSSNSEIFACLTCFETVCASSNHLLNHSHTRNHSIYFKCTPAESEVSASCIEEEFFCVLCGANPKVTGKKEKINLEKIKALFLHNRNNPVNRISNVSDMPDIPPPNFHTTESIHLQPRGLINLGNTCFMNSALQLLAATIHRHGQLKTKTDSSQLSVNLIHHLEEIYATDNCVNNKKNKAYKSANSANSVNPKEFLNLLTGKQKKFASMQQQDAHDFLRSLFNSLEDKPQVELFGGEFVSKVTCDRCRKVSETIEPFLDISLSVQSANNCHDKDKVNNNDNGNNADSITSSFSSLSLNSHTSLTIAGLLRAWNAKIFLHGDNGYYCDNCSPKSDESPLQNASLQFFLTPKLPAFLILHLQRFKTNFYAASSKGKKSKSAYNLQIEKDDTAIEFPLILTIPSECIKNGESVNYKLYGYIIHEGSSTSSGHYTSIVNASADRWFYISDTRVKEISRIKALDHETFTPYLLFYQRLDTNTNINK